MRVVLIQDEESVRDQLGFWLENTLQAEVITLPTVAEAAVKIRESEKIDLVIFNCQQNPLKEYRRFREEVGKTLPIILCLEGIISDFSATDKTARTQIANRRKIIEGLAAAIMQFKSMGALTEGGDTEEVEEGSRLFCRVRTPLLISVVPLKGDIYIKLSGTKYLKLFREGDEFNENDLQRYFHEKHVEYLFLKKDAVTEFLEKYTEQIIRSLANVEDLQIIGQSEISVHEIAHEMSKSIGFTPAVQELVKSQMSVTMKALEKNPSLKGILSKLESLKGDYLHLHSVLTGHIACGLATEVSWATGLNFQKLTMAAFLHDITLDDPKLAKISTLKEFNQDLHGAEMLKQFIDHPQRAADIANQFSDVPPDVDKIIIQHHERPDQSGFPHKLGAPRMFSLACLFIIAHDMAVFHIDHQGKETSVDEFLKQANAKYDSAQFRKILASVRKCFGR